MQNSRHSSSFRFRPTVHEMEDRTVPAGNIAAQVFDGVLYIAGDAAGNQYTIIGVGDETAVIRSLDSTTTINGQSNQQGFFGIEKGIHILAGPGDDRIQINAVHGDETINITGGGGNDIIELNGVEMDGGGIITTAGGMDQLIINGSKFGSLFSVSMNDGDDFLQMGFSKFDDMILANGGAGNNTFMMLGNDFDEPFYRGTFVEGPAPVIPPDNGSPTVTISPSTAEPTSDSPIPFTVTFSEPITGFTQFDLTPTNGTISNFRALNSTQFAFDLTPTADGAITVSMTSGAAQDADGNPTTAATSSAFSIRTPAGLGTTVPDINSPNFVPVGNAGLKVWEVQEGVGTIPVGPNSNIKAFYRGYLASNGNQFDAAVTPGDPAEFLVSDLIVGFQQGILGMTAGGIRRIFIPAALGYGSSARPGIPANSDLVFEVKLVSVS